MRHWSEPQAAGLKLCGMPKLRSQSVRTWMLLTSILKGSVSALAATSAL